MNEQDLDLNAIIIDLGEHLGQAAIDSAVLRAQHRNAVNELNKARQRIAELESEAPEGELDESE